MSQAPGRRLRPFRRPEGLVAPHTHADTLDLGFGDRRIDALDPLLPAPRGRSWVQPHGGLVRERQPLQAGPCPRLGTLDQAGAERVSFDVAQDREQMLILLNGERLESSLPYVAAGAIMPRVAPHMGRCQLMHPAAEFAVLAGPKREVEMIEHEAVGQDSHRLAQGGFGHQLDESVVVVGFVKHLGACVAAIEDMVGVSTQTGSGSASHDVTRIRRRPRTSICRDYPVYRENQQ